MRRVFENNGMLLSQDVTVSIERKESQWLITDKEIKRKYTVRKEANQLHICPHFIWPTVYRMMGRWHESLTLCRARLDIGVAQSRSTMIINMRLELGMIYLSMGEWEKAIVECESVMKMLPSRCWMPRVVRPLGDAYCKTGQLDKGIEFLEYWKADAKRIGRGPIVECEYCLPLAEGYLAKGDREKARTNAEEALHIALEQGYPLHEAQAYRILGERRFTKLIEFNLRLRRKRKAELELYEMQP